MLDQVMSPPSHYLPPLLPLYLHPIGLLMHSWDGKELAGHDANEMTSTRLSLKDDLQSVDAYLQSLN